METNEPPPNKDEFHDSKEKKGSIDLNKPCRITDISFEGVHRTRPNILASIVSDVFPARTLIDCLQKSVEVRDNLRGLNAFSEVEMQIEPADDKNEENYKIKFVVQEKGRVKASAQTSVDKYSTHLNLELSLPNILGRGDSLSFDTKFNKKFYSGECRYSIPIRPWKKLWNPIHSLIYKQYDWDSQPSGFNQRDKGFTEQIEFLSLPNLQHCISVETIWRYIKSSSIDTPIEIREQSGHSIKQSLKHVMTWDNRVGGNFPFGGIMASLSNEFTLAKFSRHEASLQLNALILPEYDVLCQINVIAGSLFRPQRSNICDRFFAGGPLTVRGFKFQGVGPSVRGYPLGASTYTSGGVHIYSILPYTRPGSPINEYLRPHLFVNAGTIGELGDLCRLKSSADIRRELERFRDSLRFSCGFGFVMYLTRLRLELNYSLPLTFKDTDLLARGFQWGFGLTYT